MALLPRSFALLPGPEIELRSLRPAPRLGVVLIWRQERRISPALSAFIKFVLDAVARVRAGAA